MASALEIYPTGLERLANGLRIQWSDGSETQYKAQLLRDECPCATCREKHKAASEDAPSTANMLLPVLSLAEARPLEIEKMRPVGNYAYNIAFSDGHDSGIFTFDYLLSLAK